MPKTASVPAMTETELLKNLRSEAVKCGWKVYRAQFSMYSVRGWPDLVCVKNGRVFAWELKTPRGTISKAQEEWIEALKAVPGIDARLVYPADLDDAYTALVTGAWPRP